MRSESMRSGHQGRVPRLPWKGFVLGALTAAGSLGLACWSGQSRPENGTSTGHRALSSAFAPQVLTPPGEAPFALRFFVTPVKTDSKGQIRTGGSTDPVIKLVGAEPAGERGGMQRYTRITFGNDYMTGKPDPGSRVDPNNPVITKGNQFWPFVPQPFRSWPNALALTPGGDKVYVTLPGREGYPDWRVAVVDTASKTVRKWVDLRPAGQSLAPGPREWRCPRSTPPSIPTPMRWCSTSTPTSPA